MRQWRVGTLSMGLLLLGVGLGLLYGQVKPAPVAEAALKWWPVIFIILGLEVLVQSLLNKGENSKIKYDIFSVFIILVIVFSGLGLQAANELGLTKMAREKINKHYYNMTLPETKIPVGNEIKKIVVEGDNPLQLGVRTTSGNEIVVYGNSCIEAQTREAAEKILTEYSAINSRIFGDTLYLDLNVNLNPGRECYETNINLLLPERLSVEIDRDAAQLEISTAQIKNNWQIKGDGETILNISSGADLMLTAINISSSDLQGNVKWTFPEQNTRPLQATIENRGSGQEVNLQIEGRDEESNYRQAQAKLGAGTYKLTIINSDQITANLIP